MLQYNHSTWLFLFVILLTSIAAAQKFFIVFSFDSVCAPQLHRRKLPLTYPDTNCFRMHTQLFSYFFDGQPLLWHKSSPLVPFVVSETTLFNIIEFSIACVNCYICFISCINLTKWYTLGKIISSGIN